jgi:hypothetical protein
MGRQSKTTQFGEEFIPKTFILRTGNGHIWRVLHVLRSFITPNVRVQYFNLHIRFCRPGRRILTPTRSRLNQFRSFHSLIRSGATCLYAQINLLKYFGFCSQESRHLKQQQKPSTSQQLWRHYISYCQAWVNNSTMQSHNSTCMKEKTKAYVR